MNITVLILAVFLVVALVVLAVALTPAALHAWRWLRDDSSPRRQAEAVIVDKRTEVTGSGRQASQTYHATFQFADGNRLELRVSGAQSGMLVAGDRGILVWQGARYLDFSREILR